MLLLDDPLSNLDANLRNAIRAELRQLQQRLRITTIYVTQRPGRGSAMSDSIAVLNAGKIIQIGSPAEIYYHPANRFVASFVGTVNFIEGSLTDIDVAAYSRRGERSSDTDRAQEVRCRTIGNLEQSKKVLLVIRPESMKILDSAQAQKDAANIFQGEIDHYIFEG